MLSHTRRAAAATILLAFLVGSSLPAVSAALPTTDRDHDGLPDWFEIHKSHTSPTKKDTDHDGISDGSENPDHDALTNRYEYLAGTNPLKGDTNRNGIGDIAISR